MARLARPLRRVIASLPSVQRVWTPEMRTGGCRHHAAQSVDHLALGVGADFMVHQGRLHGREEEGRAAEEADCPPAVRGDTPPGTRDKGGWG